MVGSPFSPSIKKAIAFLLVLFCVLRTWLGNYHIGGAAKIWLDRNLGCTPLAARIL